MIKEIKKKIQRKRNTKQNQIDSLKEENTKLLRKIEEKNELILSLFAIRDEKQRKINELLEENKEFREKRIRSCKK